MDDVRDQRVLRTQVIRVLRLSGYLPEGVDTLHALPDYLHTVFTS